MHKYDFYLWWQSGTNWESKRYHKIVEAETYEEAEKIATKCDIPDDIVMLGCQEITDTEKPE